MHDALTDELFIPAFKAFLYDQKVRTLELLLSAIRKLDRDTMKEAQLAGMVQVYEELWADLQIFSQKQLQEATQ